jgi:ribonuclease D
VIPLIAPTEGVPDPVTTVEGFAEVARLLRGGSGPVALDTERASGFTYSSRAYLIQIKRTGSGLFLLDPLYEPEGLAPVIDALRGVEWVLHSADQDLPCLRDDGFVCDELFDTELAGRLLGEPRVNLAAMTETYTGYGLAKGHGAADWSTRPLPDDWLNYAALDVDVLVDLRDEVRERLVDTGKLEWALEEFEYERTRPSPEPRVDPWRRTSGISTLRSRRQLARARELWLARDELAETRNTAPGRTLPDKAIVQAAAVGPTSEAELIALPVFGGPKMRKSAGRWLEALRRADALPDKKLPSLHGPKQGLPPANRWSRSNPEAAERLARVRAALAAISEEVAVPLENLLPPDAVRQLCWDGTVTDAAAVDAALVASGARRWQRGLTVPAVTVALQSA